MSDTANLDSPKLSELILVALSDLRDPDWNPRPYLDESEMPSLVEYVKAGRFVPPIEILKAPDQAGAGSNEPAHPNRGSQLEASTQGPWDVISGKRRCEAYRRAGKTHIEAIVRNVPLEEAKFMAIAANKDNKPFWLGEFIAVENLVLGNQQLEQKVIAQKLGWSEKRVSQAIALTDLLNPATRQQIFLIFRQAVTARNSTPENKGKSPDPKKGWQLTEDVAVRLIPILENPSRNAAQVQAEKVIKIIVDRQLTGPQTDDLVAHILSGQDSAQFEPAAKVRKARTPSPQKTGAQQSAAHHSQLPGELAEKVVELGPNTQPALHIVSHPESSSHAGSAPKEASPTATRQDSEGQAASGDDLIVWEWLAGVSFISQIRSKLKKREKLTAGEMVFVVGWRLTEGLGLLLKPIGKLFKEALKGFWHSVKSALGKTFTRFLEVAFPVILICLLIWGAAKVFQMAVLNPWHWLKSKVVTVLHGGFGHSSTPSASQQTIPNSAVPPAAAPVIAVPAPKAIMKKRSSAQKPAPSPKEAAETSPAAAQSPAGISTAARSQQDINNTEAELAPLPPNPLIQTIAYNPGPMTPDMASRRLSDLTDPEKYSVYLGHDKQKLLDLQASASNCVFTFQSGLGGLLGNKSKMEFYWEDVTAIHVSEIKCSPNSGISSPSGTQKVNLFYQCSLLASSLKIPLTVQCANAENLERLVTALEFNLKSSRGSAVPVSGMPYLNQGLRLGADGLITVLWAGSPMDHAGVKLGEIAWSLDKDGLTQTRPADLEAALKTLTPGPHRFYTTTPEQWQRAAEDVKANPGEIFSPIRKKITITVI